MTDARFPPGRRPLPQIDSSVSHSARIWNYWVDGEDNYPVDRQVGAEIRKFFPDIVDLARASRQFLARSVRHLTAEVGIRQFLDIGTGLPTHDNTHEVAQRVAPQARIVYVDNDPMVLAHARALLTSAPEDVTDYLDADLREPDRILGAAARTLDFSQPIALMLLGVLEHVPDDDEADSIVKRILAALPSGSHMVFNDATNVINGEAMEALARQWNQDGSAPIALRDHRQVGRFFEGLEILSPGVVSCSRWWPEPGHLGEPAEVAGLAAIGRKP
jgi:O-methyltransferase involved in polyketide biosynthesis